jgi:hypothetical protein
MAPTHFPKNLKFGKARADCPRDLPRRAVPPPTRATSNAQERLVHPANASTSREKTIKEPQAMTLTRNATAGAAWYGSESRPKTANPFVSMMFIHLCHNTPPAGQLLTTARRVLLDTGADFNLIGHMAHAEMKLSHEPSAGRVCSIGGYAELKSAVVLQWHFRIPLSDRLHSAPVHRALFYVLPPETDVRFDCILGRNWIAENFSDFISMVQFNRGHQKEGAGC